MERLLKLTEYKILNQMAQYKLPRLLMMEIKLNTINIFKDQAESKGKLDFEQ